MGAYLLRRLFGLIPVLIGVSILVFAFVRAIPGDPARVMLGERATEESVRRIREDLGLNRPLPEQYLKFVGNLLRGDLGTSIFSQIPIKNDIQRRFPATLELSIAAMLFATTFGVLLGVVAAIRRNSSVDNLTMAVALVGVSMPVFWLGMILKYIFSIQTKVFPPSARISDLLTFTFVPITNLLVLDGILRFNPAVVWDALLHLVMPAVALGTIPMAIIARMTRSSMVEVLSQDYVRTARAKGLVQRSVIWKHALRNAMLPVITVIGLSFGTLLSGAVLTETIFAWSGIGSWIYEGIFQRDYPVVQSGVLLVSLVFVLVNLIVDVSYAAFDPRIQYR
ncbi:MAG: ABC transporter permease [Pleurocapsa sp. SU_196_0]|nr:ABC transporter permease [Pleurocapsa sp. SU_196_0]